MKGKGRDPSTWESLEIKLGCCKGVVCHPFYLTVDVKLSRRYHRYVRITAIYVKFWNVQMFYLALNKTYWSVNCLWCLWTVHGDQLVGNSSQNQYWRKEFLRKWNTCTSIDWYISVCALWTSIKEPNFGVNSKTCVLWILLSPISQVYL